jgi:succinate dehydrogenase/fumarate reductase-like Fe-S protein
MEFNHFPLGICSPFKIFYRSCHLPYCCSSSCYHVHEKPFFQAPKPVVAVADDDDDEDDEEEAEDMEGKAIIKLNILDCIHFYNTSFMQ